MKTYIRISLWLSGLLLMVPGPALAWGKRGHQVIGETAALLAAQEPGAGFMKSRSFDFGYYNNVPDFIWKRPKTYEMERNQHFMDLEIFEEAFKKKPEVKKPFELSRKEFEAQFPDVNEKAGRAFWRIREMNDQLSAITKQLRELGKDDSKQKERQALQEKWLVLAGTMGHYVADLSQPLHVTENYDGQKTGQKGIHSHYEDDAVDELYPMFRVDVHKEAVKRWPEFKKKNGDKSLVDLLIQLSQTSMKDLKPLLETDKKNKRDPLSKSAAQFEKLIVKNLVEGSLTLAEIYRRQLGWKFDGRKFYFFAGEPDFIVPGAAVRP